MSAGKSELIGRTIAGKFVVEAPIGSGAMAAVFRARHLGLGKTVALKIMHRSLAVDPLFAARFHREAQTASRLDHPGSIRILDFGEEEEGELLYIAMELVDGCDLHETLVDEWPLGDARVVGILSQVLAAVAVAHDLGIVHRDLKPENILLVRGKDDEGHETDVVKVCDFGIAKMAEPRGDPGPSGEQPNITATGFVVGTPEYMAPEQARGEAIDGRADLYSVGIILYRMLTRVPPFQAGSALGVAVKQIFEEAPPPSTRVPGVHPGLAAICVKAMKKNPGERYQTAREMRAELRATLAGPDAPARSEPSPVPRVATVIEAAATIAAPLRVPAALPARPADAGGAAPRGKALRRAAVPALGVVLLAFAVSRGADRGAHAAREHADRVVASAAPSAVPPVPAPRAVTTVLPVVLVPEPPPPIASAPPRPIAVLALSTAAAAIARPEPAAPPQETVAAAPPAAEAVASIAPVPPVRAETPPVAPAPAPAVATAAPVVDLEAAHVSLGGVTTTSGVSAASVRSALGHASFTRCYREALRASGTAAEGTARLHLAIDDTGHVTSATVTGLDFAPGARGCIDAAARGLRVPNVDTGDATADATLTFSLR